MKDIDFWVNFVLGNSNPLQKKKNRKEKLVEPSMWIRVLYVEPNSAKIIHPFHLGRHHNWRWNQEHSRSQTLWMKHDLEDETWSHIYLMENFHMMKSNWHVNAINTMLVKWSIAMKIMNLDNIIDEIDNMDCHMDENWLN